MKKSELKSLIKQSIKEAIILQQQDGIVYAVSDLDDAKERSRETFKNKDKLKKFGFKWNAEAGAWSTPASDLKSLTKNINKSVNKNHPVIDTIENLPAFVRSQAAVDKKKELSNKIDSYIKDLMDDVSGVIDSDEFERFMAFHSKFRKYSLNNTVLIYTQKRNASRVAGFNKWKELGRIVKKGATPIWIFAPMTKKVEEKDFDAAVKEKQFTFFRPVKVYDISDTEATDKWEDSSLEWHDDNTPNETADELTELAMKLSKKIGVDVTKDVAHGGEMGYSAGGKINLTSNIEGVNQAATLIHEIAHELLHWKTDSKFKKELEKIGAQTGRDMPQDLKELQAESVAYLVLKHYDLPVKQKANYLAMWGANKEKIMSQLQTLKKTADFIITELDKIAEQ